MFLFHRDIEPVQIFQARYASPATVVTFFPIKAAASARLFLSSTGDYDVRAFFN